MKHGDGKNKKKDPKSDFPEVGEGFTVVRRNDKITFEGMKLAPKYWVLPSGGAKLNFHEAIHFFGKPIYCQTYFEDWKTNGDVDLCFCLPGGIDIIVLELKNLDSGSNRAKAKKQVLRAIFALKSANASYRFHGFILCGMNLHYVGSTDVAPGKVAKKLYYIPGRFNK